MTGRPGTGARAVFACCWSTCYDVLCLEVIQMSAIPAEAPHHGTDNERIIRRGATLMHTVCVGLRDKGHQPHTTGRHKRHQHVRGVQANRQRSSTRLCAHRRMHLHSRRVSDDLRRRLRLSGRWILRAGRGTALINSRVEAGLAAPVACDLGKSGQRTSAPTA